MENGQLKVWWKPQVPMKSFEVLVDNLKEAHLLLDVLAEYDLFQLKHKIKGDYCNVGGLLIWDETIDEDVPSDKWTDWVDEETGDDFDEYRKKFQQD